MEQPKVPVYVYPYTPKPVYVLKICNWEERIETSEVKAYYIICCSVGGENTFFPEVQLVRMLFSPFEDAEPVRYISMGLAAKLLQQSIQKDYTYTYYSPSFIKRGIAEASQLAQTYQETFDSYTKKRWAIQYIQGNYLKNYYDPTRPFCRARLERDLEELQKDIHVLS